ncbi:hypothetical protein [Bacillus sp. AG4(2022)]|uniref:hypothetical protein n=1 Tax=Bacillus sp. AG4(2022) TaxID=2962594 RepID=UPI002880C8BE|nr:hypothetical protein [Bacillus sp. AG4(2022)]MDT0160378.1 hypothetical protein [Bacillus sp. AG4(2022)]
MKDTLVISGFPGVGKSHLYQTNEKLAVLDSDSSRFSWINLVRNPQFPDNYMRHIKNNLGFVDNILISSHDVVRKALKENNLNYVLVYPSIDLKEEYIERYKSRGSSKDFIEHIENNWEKYILEIEKETFPKLLRLESGQYLKDALEAHYLGLI